MAAQPAQAKMLTVFAVPKAFDGEFGRIQRNALGSWRALGDELEIVLIGDEAGVAEEAAAIGAVHVPLVRCDEWGAPLVNEVFRIGSEVAKGELQAYVNADILLMRDFLGVLEALKGFRRPVLVIGQRWDLDFQEAIDFSDPTWENRIALEVSARGTLHHPSGMDYFLFRRGAWKEIPPFALGRTMWDNWLVYSARSRGLAVVDATPSLLAVHQDHSYGPRPEAYDWVWAGPQAQKNLELAKGFDHYFTNEDATHRLVGGKVRIALDREHLTRRWARFWILWPPAAAFSGFLRRISKLIYGARVRVARWRGRI